MVTISDILEREMHYSGLFDILFQLSESEQREAWMQILRIVEHNCGVGVYSDIVGNQDITDQQPEMESIIRGSLEQLKRSLASRNDRDSGEATQEAGAYYVPGDGADELLDFSLSDMVPENESDTEEEHQDEEYVIMQDVWQRVAQNGVACPSSKTAGAA